MKIVIGSRGSQLALAQSELVKSRLEAYDSSLDIEIKVISTKGDRILDRPLSSIGDKGLFTKEIEEQLLSGEIDMAVHSMKDMPSVLPDGLVFSGTIMAEDPRDCLVFNGDYHSIDDLPLGATIGTGSPRRIAQLLKYRSDLNIVGIRGNVQTRIRKMHEENMDAIVLACAGLKRLNDEHYIGHALPYDIMVPAAAQGILAIEVKEGSPLLELLKNIEDHKSTRRMELERLYLSTIGGSCHVPIGAHVELLDEGIEFYGLYGHEEGPIYNHHEVIVDNIEQRIVEIAEMLKDQVSRHG